MTFIISKIVDGKFINHSDSMISDLDILTQKYAPNENIFSSILKTVIISMDLCISYAGDVYTANACIKELLNLPKSFKIIHVFDILKKHSIKSNEKTIFGIAIINKDGKIKQAKIIGNNFQDYTNSLMWLGDSRAYEIFNKNYQEFLQQKPEKESIELAFESVINNKQINSVGHFGIVTSTIDQKMKHTSYSTGKVTDITRKVFDYSIKASMNLTKPKTISIKEKNKWQDIPADLEKGDVEGISYFTSSSPSKFGVAIYNLKEKKGILLCPQIKVEPELFDIVKGNTISVPQQDFIDEIYKKYKLPMTGMIFLNNMTMKYIANFQEDEPRS